MKRRYKGRGTSIKKKPATVVSLIFSGFCSRIKEQRLWFAFWNIMIKKQLPSSCCIFLTTNESDYRPWWAPASYGLVALTIFEVSCGNFIRHILSRISGACWKLLMTDVSPHCHTPCIIWFGKQHTVFCSISMSPTVCKQLVITQFSENHYFPMKCWTRSKLGFGMASAAPRMQCSSALQVAEEGWREQVRRLSTSPPSLALWPSGARLMTWWLVAEQIRRMNKEETNA